MITVSENSIVIEIKDMYPAARRNHIVKALAAAMRWFASSDNQHTGDDMHVATLSELLSDITGEEE